MKEAKKWKKCPRCNGKGFLLPNQYQGRCIDGKRHRFTKYNGQRSSVCLNCGIDYKTSQFLGGG